MTDAEFRQRCREAFRECVPILVDIVAKGGPGAAEAAAVLETARQMKARARQLLASLEDA